MGLVREAGGPVVVEWAGSDCQGMNWHRTWRRSHVLWMLTEKMAQDMGRFCLSQWHEWLFPETTERHWTPELKKVEFWAIFCLCDCDYPVLLILSPLSRSQDQVAVLLPWLAVSTIGFLNFIFKGNCFIKKNNWEFLFFPFTNSMPLIWKYLGEGINLDCLN